MKLRFDVLFDLRCFAVGVTARRMGGTLRVVVMPLPFLALLLELRAKTPTKLRRRHVVGFLQ